MEGSVKALEERLLKTLEEVLLKERLLKALELK